MSACKKISLANIRRNKGRSFLNCLTFLVVALIFCAGISMLTMSQEPFDKTFNNLNTSHMIMYCNSDEYSDNVIEEFWNKRDEVESVNKLNMWSIEGKAKVNNQSIDTYLLVTEYSKDQSKDRVEIFEGENENTPGENEIWISTQFAFDNEISVGDSLSIPVKDGVEDFKVSAIVIDPQYCVGVNNPTRVWMKEGEIVKNFSEKPRTMFGIRYKEYSEDEEIAMWKDFKEYLGGNFSGYNKEYSVLISEYKSSYEQIGLIMVSLSIIILLFACVIISFIISNSICEDYKIIGVYKAQGFSTKNIIWIYMQQYILLACISIPLGAICSIPVIKELTTNVTKTLGRVGNSNNILFSIIITIIVNLLIITLVAFNASRKVSKIKPAQAIRYGTSEEKIVKSSKFTIKPIKGCSLLLQLAIKDMLAKKKSVLIILFGMLITSLMITFANTSIESYTNAFNDPSLIGWDSSDLSISNSNRTKITSKEIYEKFKNDEAIQDVIPLQFLSGSTFDLGDGLTKTVMGYAYDGDMNIVEISNIEGRNPEKSNEISLSTTLLEKLNKKVGDTIEVELEGDKKQLVIIGSFFTMNSGGYLFRIQESAIETSKQKMDLFQVNLKDNVNVGEYSNKLEKENPEVYDIQNNKKFIADIFDQILSLIKVVALLIQVVVVVVCIIAIFNLISTEINSMRKTYGIYKSFGMSFFQIRKILLHKVLLISIVGSILGIIIGYNFSEKVLKSIVAQQGLTKYTVSLNPKYVVLTIVICILVAVISTFIASRKINKIKTRELVVE